MLFAGDVDDRKSTNGLGGTIVSWLSKKQSCVAKYTMEAEYISCSTAVSEVFQIKRFVDSLKLGISNKLVDVFYDNKFGISLIKSGANSSKGKYIVTHYHYSRYNGMG